MRVTLKIHSQLRAKISRTAREAAAVTMKKAVKVAIDALSRVADATLHKTAPEFKAMLPESVIATDTALLIELQGIAKDLDKGFPARDMKAEMLASPGAKTGKNGGRYIDVPFKHQVESRYAGMPSQLKTRVKAVVQKERRDARSEGREMHNPLRVLGSMPGRTNQQTRFNTKGRATQINVKHKTSIYSDMFRMAKKVGSTVSGSYQTIRRISANSDPQSWFHPGFQGIRALKQVEKELRQALQTMFKAELLRSGLKSR